MASDKRQHTSGVAELIIRGMQRQGIPSWRKLEELCGVSYGYLQHLSQTQRRDPNPTCGCRRGSLISSLIHVRVPRFTTGRSRAPSRAGDHHGQPWTVILNPEKRYMRRCAALPWGRNWALKLRSTAGVCGGQGLRSGLADGVVRSGQAWFWRAACHHRFALVRLRPLKSLGAGALCRVPPVAGACACVSLLY